MLIDAGKESEYKEDELIPLEVNTFSGSISSFPKVDEGWHVACAFNQFGMKGMAKMYICQNVEDMQELYRKYHMGYALQIKWYKIPDTHFVKVQTLDEWLKSESPSNNKTASNTLFSPKEKQSDSSEQKQVIEEKPKGLCVKS